MDQQHRHQLRNVYKCRILNLNLLINKIPQEILMQIKFRTTALVYFLLLLMMRLLFLKQSLLPV